MRKKKHFKYVLLKKFNLLKDNRTSFSSSFTLVELLIVIGILAILTAAVVIAINPAELLKQARDSQRMQDLSSVDKALSVIETMNPSADFGTASTIYVSIPDTSATCANLGLPTLPSGWAYACVTEENLHNSNGTGWIPVDFTNSYGTLSLSSLPTDPTNTTTTRQYYTYVTGGSWKLATILESTKYQATQAKDGGSDYATYEKGSDLTLAPFTHGLLGWWRFEGDFTDSSGMGNDGTGQNGVTFADGYSGQAAFFDGVDDYVDFSSLNNRSIGRNFTVLSFIKTSSASEQSVLSNRTVTSWGPMFFGTGTGKVFVYGSCAGDATAAYGTTLINDGSFHLIGYAQNGDALTKKIYVDGLLESALIGSACNAQNFPVGTFGVDLAGLNKPFSGYIDNIIIYGRILDDEQINSIYNNALF